MYTVDLRFLFYDTICSISYCEHPITMVRFQTITPEEYTTERYKHFKIIYGFHATPFGQCLLGITDTDKAVVFLGFVVKSANEACTELKDIWPSNEIMQDTGNETEKMVKKIFSERVSKDDSIVVLVKGTEFQVEVWKALLRISEGTTTTYEEIAKDIGRPKAARGVGNALNKNRIAYLIPCHRVMGKSGSNKYRWGANLKESILMHERKFVNT